MCAFLSNPPTLPSQSKCKTTLCPRRSVPACSRPHIRFSAVTDEVRPLDSAQPIDELNPPVHAPRAQPDPSSLNESPNRTARTDRRDGRRDRSTAPPPFVTDPKATYYTKCGTCQAAYQLDPTELGKGKKVACAVCANEWFQKPDRLLILKDTEAFKNYPIEKKDELISESRAGKRDRHHTSRRENRDRRAPRSRAQFSVFIGNIPFSVKDNELEELVKSRVNAFRVSIVRDATGRSKGFAFADVSSEDEVQTAVEQLNGFELGGRAIAVRAGRKNT